MPNPRTFFDLTVSDKPSGRVVFELFADVVPKTAENFRALCVGHQGPDGSQGYKGSPIHRVIDGFMIQGGDYTKRNGTGGASIYGGMFKDERLEGPGTEVDKEGLLVMANRGPDTNGSQYFVTLAPSPHSTGKHVVFGRVVSGMEHIATIGKSDTDERDRPSSPVIVSHCGELELRRRARTPSPTPSEDSEEEYRRRKRERRERKEKEREERRRERKERRRDRSRSRSPSRRDKEDREDRDRSDRRDRKDRKEKKERRSRRRRSDSRDSRDSRNSRSRSPSETLSELDARLSREETERLEAERKAREEEKRARIAAERERAKESGGIVYKGRGTMRYRDPDAGWDTWGRPENYNARGQDTRSRFHRRDGGGDRWERGMDVRADRFERERGDRGGRDSRERFDRWDHGRRGRDERDDKRDDRREEEERKKSDQDSDKSLAERISSNYEEKPAEPAEGKEQRASAWNAARRASPSPDRGARSPSSDMVMDDDD